LPAKHRASINTLVGRRLVVKGCEDKYFDLIVRHCFLTEKIDCCEEALNVARHRGLIADNKPTVSGLIICDLMENDLLSYQQTFDVVARNIESFYRLTTY
tara:strand:- start:195 stop:494 length:300 start_codon:yes stop_codon:yes gene_type:complete